MKFKNTHNKSYDIDGKKIWESRSVAVNTVVLIKDKNLSDEFFVLSSKRGPGAADYNGLWNIPAGYLDYDETTSEAAVRETWEETNVNLYSLMNITENKNNYIINENIKKEWGTNSSTTNNRQNVSFRFGICLVMENFISKITLSDKNSEPNEISEIKWIPISQLDKYEWAFGHDNLIKEYINEIL